jgi:TPP-dependent pyruvate/acetoin dehydrogenase alpha subunit
MPGVIVDGTDVTACYEAASAAVARARSGEGPTFIEAKVWRINSHTSEDNQLKYRSAEELEEAKEKDPIAHFEQWLQERGWLTADEAAHVRDDCDREAAEAADWAEQQPDPLAEETETNVFA